LFLKPKERGKLTASEWCGRKGFEPSLASLPILALFGHKKEKGGEVY